MIKLKNTGGGVEINKIGPVFTQLGLEDGLNLDDLVREFFTVYSTLNHVFMNFSEFYIVLDLVIWRSTNMNNTIYIRPWTATTLILDYLGATNSITFAPFFITSADQVVGPNYDWLEKQSRGYSFSLYTTNQISWTPEWGYVWNFRKFLSGQTTISGSFLSYLKHFEMLGRKINFRRKVLKKKFEDYT